MSFVFVLPEVGEGVVEAEIVAWLVNIGEVVAIDTPICEVSTDKATLEISSPRAGRILKMHGEPGKTIQVYAPLVEIDESVAGETSAHANGHVWVVSLNTPRGWYPLVGFLMLFMSAFAIFGTQAAFDGNASLLRVGGVVSVALVFAGTSVAWMVRQHRRGNALRFSNTEVSALLDDRVLWSSGFHEIEGVTFGLFGQLHIQFVNGTHETVWFQHGWARRQQLATNIQAAAKRMRSDL